VELLGRVAAAKPHYSAEEAIAQAPWHAPWRPQTSALAGQVQRKKPKPRPVGSSRGEGAKGGTGDRRDSGIIGFEFLPRPPSGNGSNGGHARQEVRRQWDEESEGYQTEGYDTEGYEEQYFPALGKDKGKGKGKEQPKMELKEQGSRAPRGATSIMAAAARWGKLEGSRREGDEGESACGSESVEESRPQEVTITRGKGAAIGPLRVPSDLQEAINVLAGRRAGGGCRKGNIDLAAVELMEERQEQDGFVDMDSFLDCQRLLASAAEWLVEMQRPGHSRGWSREVS